MPYSPSAEYDTVEQKSNRNITQALSSRSLEQLYTAFTEATLNIPSSQEVMPAFTAAYQSPISTVMPHDSFSLPSSASSTATSFDLQDVIHQFRTQPDLLQLILNSKVEEDRRRAEEAKLRGKEIDYYLQRKQQEPASLERTSPKISETLAPIQISRRDIMDTSSHYSNDIYSKPSHRSLTIAPSRSQGFVSGVLAQPSGPRRYSAFESLLSTSPLNLDRRMGTSEDEHRHRSSHENSPRQMSTSPRSPDLDFMLDDESNVSNSQSIEKKKRKRREMQAVTTIVETRDPYNDEYLWKNNGNTLHKKTGQKSTYYKCSNSNKGCPVNKTVTLRENDTYLIKYRGSHLPECNRVKRIVDM